VFDIIVRASLCKLHVVQRPCAMGHACELSCDEPQSLQYRIRVVCGFYCGVFALVGWDALCLVSLSLAPQTGDVSFSFSFSFSLVPFV
jgi:hypothetical protein